MIDFKFPSITSCLDDEKLQTSFISAYNKQFIIEEQIELILPNPVYAISCRISSDTPWYKCLCENYRELVLEQTGKEQNQLYQLIRSGQRSERINCTADTISFTFAPMPTFCNFHTCGSHIGRLSMIDNVYSR